jgi:hypothetical protein
MMATKTLGQQVDALIEQYEELWQAMLSEEYTGEDRAEIAQAQEKLKQEVRNLIAKYRM